MPSTSGINQENGIDRHINDSVTFFAKEKFPDYSNFMEVLQQCFLIRNLNGKRMKITIHIGNA